MNVLINRTDALGDSVLTLPFAQAFKQQYPQAKITFLASKHSYELLQYCPYLDDVWLYQKKDLKQQIRTGDFTHYFYGGGSHYPSYLAWKFAIPFRGGLKSRLPGFLFLNQGVRQRRSREGRHEADYNLSFFGLEAPLKLNLISKQKLPVVDFSSPYIVIHPGMSGHSEAWPAGFYAEWIHLIEKASPGKFHFVVSFTAADQKRLAEFKKILGEFPRIVFFDGKKQGMERFLALLAGASLYAGGSTGPTHLASALQRPVVSVYPPLPAQAVTRWGPYANPLAKVLTPPVECPETVHCLKEACAHFPCMEKVTPYDFFQASL